MTPIRNPEATGPVVSHADDDDAHIVVVGAGQAGTLTAEALRSGGYSGAITLLGDEPSDPYHRPPLSKAWLAGEISDAQLALRPPGMLARKNIALRTGERVQAIDRVARRVLLADGQQLAYSGLALATGATPRRLPLPGFNSPLAQPLRSREDAAAIAAGLADCVRRQQPLVIIGGGFIGLEVAATARKKGLAVTVLEAAPRLLGRVLTPELSAWYAQLHRAHGVTLVLDARIDHLDSSETDAGPEAAVVMADGSRHACGRVVLGVGVSANDQLAADAGLPCERGIIVDACGRTADPRIVAAGDCTARRLDNGQLLRLESVQNATEQARSAAAALLGQARPFTATPWFWSDQFDQKLQMAGISAGADGWTLRGTMSAEAGFSVYHFLSDRLIAVDSVNATQDHLRARKLLDAGVSPTPEQAADPAFDLSRLLAPAA